MVRSGLLAVVVVVSALLTAGVADSASAQADVRFNSAFQTNVAEAWFWADYAIPQAARVDSIARDFGFSNDFVRSGYLDLEFAARNLQYGYATGAPIYLYLAYAHSTVAANYEYGIYDYAITDLKPQLGGFAEYQEFERSAYNAYAGATYMSYYAYVATVLAYSTAAQ